MAASYRQRYLGIVRQHEADMAALFADLAAQINSVISRHTVGDAIPLERLSAVRRDADPLVTRMFLAPTLSGDMAAFDVVNGQVTPLSPWMRAFWRHIVDVTRLGVEEHARMMERNLESAPDVLAAFRSADTDPFVYARRVSEFRRRPFLRYDPLHLFVYDDGIPYRLSDRIWDTSASTRRKVDAYLDYHIRQGAGAFAMQRDLERFLQPGRADRRTWRPYGRIAGTDASADAMRLGRTEITAAHTRAGFMSAQLNPFVERYRVNLSPVHRCCDECDDVAAGSPYEMTDTRNLPPIHPHCMCYVTWETARRSEVVEDLRSEMARGDEERATRFINPLMIELFVLLLLGEIEPRMEAA